MSTKPSDHGGNTPPRTYLRQSNGHHISLGLSWDQITELERREVEMRPYRNGGLLIDLDTPSKR